MAVLNLDSPTRINHFFECSTSIGSSSDLSWTKEEGTRRFPVIILNSGLRMDFAPMFEEAAGPSDTGVYTCTNGALDPPLSVSVNITGGE